MKKVITILLSTFVVISVGAMIYKGTMKSEAITKDETSHDMSRRIDATYFHGTQRCYTCNLMERYIRETVSEHFKDQVEEGKINLQSINVEEPNNNHFIKDYKLYTKSFVLSLKSEGKEEKWFNCDKIWNLAKNEEKFKTYIKAEIEQFLELL